MTATLGEELCTCQIDDERDIATLFADPQFSSFDHIPVRRGSSIIGVMSREGTGTIKENLRPLDESNLISAQEPLTYLIPFLSETPYRLVLKGVSIQGIVTRSDLLKLPVRLFIFSLVTHLEMLMSEIIRATYPDSQDDSKWLEKLKENRRKKVKAKHEELKHRNYGLPLLECTDFCDKRDIVNGIGRFSDEFKDDLGLIENLRNTVAHAGNYARDDKEMEKFIVCIQIAGKWIEELQNRLTNKQ